MPPAAPAPGPRLAGLPPPLMTSEPGSFARSTIVERKPQIIAQVAADSHYPAEIVAGLEALRDEIARLPIRPLAETAAAAAVWNRQVAIHQGKTWLELPWYFAETYFYRRLLEAVRYFAHGAWRGHDPFGRRKRKEEQQAIALWTESWRGLAQLGAEQRFRALLHASLWGNRADLSNLAVREQARAGLTRPDEQQCLLIDHTAQVRELLSAGATRVDFVNDNTGLEMIFDLALADFLLAPGAAEGQEGKGWAKQIVFHLKDRPFFVSDAMPQDVEAILVGLRATPLGRRLAGHVRAGRLALKHDPFWTSWLGFREDQMPAQIRVELAQADLVLLKGDVNYRRLLDDRHWQPTARLEEIAAGFPAPFAVLRTLKAEIMAGLAPGQAEEVAAQDPDWLINGKRGIIQLVHPL